MYRGEKPRRLVTHQTRGCGVQLQACPRIKETWAVMIVGLHQAPKLDHRKDFSAVAGMKLCGGAIIRLRVVNKELLKSHATINSDQILIKCLTISLSVS